MKLGDISFKESTESDTSYEVYEYKAGNGGYVLFFIFSNTFFLKKINSAYQRSCFKFNFIDNFTYLHAQ